MATSLSAELDVSPQECLRALQKAVAVHFDWRMMTGGKVDAPRFVIEKRVAYAIVRGMNMHSVFQVVGECAPTGDDGTQLRYKIHGQPGVPLFEAGISLAFLLALAAIIASLAFSPLARGGLPLLLLLFVVLLGSAGLYAYLKRRAYLAHLHDLQRFMQTFIKHMHYGE